MYPTDRGLKARVNFQTGRRKTGRENFLLWKRCSMLMQEIVCPFDPGVVMSFSILSMIVHAWNYRRYILANMPTPKPQSSELSYTSYKIEANFSNFSAWHQRSKVLSSLWDQGSSSPSESREGGELYG